MWFEGGFIAPKTKQGIKSNWSYYLVVDFIWITQ